MATEAAEKSILGLENPMGTDGFEFVEYTAPDTALLRELFTKMGFPVVARHKRKDVTLHRQGDINFIINAESGSYAEEYAKAHGPSACAMAFRVKDAKAAFERAVRLGATPVKTDIGKGEMDIPAIAGIGGSYLFFVDRYGGAPGSGGSIYDVDFDFFPDWKERMAGLDSRLTYIDHLTHNVNRGRMAVWADFYERLFNFREIRYFDIEGKQTGLISKAMTSPDGKIRIPLNESQDDKSQIEEFLREYKGEGIQHIALGTSNIYEAVDIIRVRGIEFQDTPNTYYELLDERVKGHGEPAAELKQRQILLDGAPTEGQGLLLQIFTKNVIGPIFFEIIQRKGNEGFGEGNFKALFESIELDQMRRGVL
jgi:4-hydroxyphenylpyruvate dioxygenase